MKIRLVGPKLFHADGRIDGQTYMTKLIALFAISLNAKNEQSCHRKWWMGWIRGSN